MSTFSLSRFEALHVVPMSELFALNACNAWGNGMEVEGPTFVDQTMLEFLGGA